MGNARRIAIVGAGLGGLAAAIALRRQGFEVQVYEQAAELAEFGAGINISPNSVLSRRRPRRQAACNLIGAGRLDLARLGFGRDLQLSAL
jgi:flavin-dependent dehydrogenase